MMQLSMYQLGPMGTNCYLIADSETKLCALVDPGAKGQELAALLRQNGLTLTAVFLTHGHFDHVGGLKALQEEYPNLPIYLHEADTQLDGHLSKGLVWTDHYGEGSKIPVGGLLVQVFHTPGHTPGSVCLAVEDALLTGDTLFAGSCGRTDFPLGNWDQMQESLKRLGQIQGNAAILPGHGETSDLDSERKHNPYLREAMGR